MWNQTKDADMSVGYTGGWCLKYVQDAFGTDHPYATAIDAWNANYGGGNHPGEVPPLGITVAVYFSLGNVPAGHVAIRLDDGWVASSTQPGTHATPYYHKSLDDLIAVYGQYNGGCTYLGWSEFVGSQRVVEFAPAKVTATADQVKQAYLDILKRPADDGGIQTYTTNGMNNDEVRNDLLNSNEHSLLIAKEEAQAVADREAQVHAQAVAQAAADAAKLAAEQAQADADAKAQADAQAKVKQDAIDAQGSVNEAPAVAPAVVPAPTPVVTPAPIVTKIPVTTPDDVFSVPPNMVVHKSQLSASIALIRELAGLAAIKGYLHALLTSKTSVGRVIRTILQSSIGILGFMTVLVSLPSFSGFWLSNPLLTGWMTPVAFIGIVTAIWNGVGKVYEYYTSIE